CLPSIILERKMRQFSFRQIQPLIDQNYRMATIVNPVGVARTRDPEPKRRNSKRNSICPAVFVHSRYGAELQSY
ncbi:hypothetical protein T265_08499, partial [Opisthorchis viverrini]